MDALRLLREGELEVRGRLTVSSNAALVGLVSLPTPDGEPDAILGTPDGLLAQLLGDDPPPPGRTVAAVVHKPIAFERPLWDFPDGTLAQREVAAYLVSEASGWGIVPTTILRDGPAGPGMVQLWIDQDPAIDAWELVQADDARLRPMALLDAVLNNTDRKGGHILPVREGEDVRLYGVDHGVCFSVDPKLRTVLWAWRGGPIADAELDVIGRLRADLEGGLVAALGELLDPAEVEATRARLDALLETRRFPMPSADWPAVPWPPY
ncbi:MAG: SCO1664 family protein [Chloroflexota bacterium]